MNKLAAAVFAASLCTPAFAAEAPLDAFEVNRAEVEPAPTLVLPANTEVSLTMNQTLTTKGNSLHEGDSFGLTVGQSVLVDGYVVIPQGARATGRITWMTSKGAFGKSGKMEISLDYVEVGGRRIPIEGTYRQEGEGNTVATVGGVIAVGVFAGFVTGKSAVIPQGRELTARTKQDLPIRVAARPIRLPAPYAEQDHGTREAAFAPVRPQRSGREQAAQASWGLVPVARH
jgi:hypothetical protein